MNRFMTMKQMLFSALVGCALLIGFAGCTPAEAPAAEGESPGTSSAVVEESGASTASVADMVNCEKCEIAVDKATLVSVDGKMVCTHCAPEGTATETKVEMGKCADCGKEMAKTELIAHGAVMVCKSCEAAHGH